MVTANTESTPTADTSVGSVSSTDQIAKALVKAQAEMKNPTFDTTNPHFRNKFASLAAVRNAVVPALNKNGIFVTQDVTTVEGGIACKTILIHESGQTLTFGPLVMPAQKPDAQGLGSATTYAKRYSLQAVCGVVGDEDDDGNAAVGTNGKSLADRSGRPDTSRVDPDIADQYAQRMWDIVQAGDRQRATKLHWELNEDEALYTAASDIYRSICKTNKFAYGGDKWKGLLDLKEAH